MIADFPGTQAGRRPNVVAAAFAGTDAGIAGLVPAARVLRRSVPSSRLLLLWPSPLRLPPSIRIAFDDHVDYGAPADAAALCRTIDTLAVAACDCMIVFSQIGWSPYVPAYLAYLAGIARRAGLTTEFGGAVLSDPVASPADGLSDEDRHLFLLQALGFERSAKLADEGDGPFAKAESAVEGRA